MNGWKYRLNSLPKQGRSQGFFRMEQSRRIWTTAINSCTINPARLIGLERKKGSVQAGKDADLVVLRDDYSVEMTICRGSVTK